MANQNSIQMSIQLKNIFGDSIKAIIQFKSQVIINAGQIRKIPEKGPNCVQNRQKRRGLIKN